MCNEMTKEKGAGLPSGKSGSLIIVFTLSSVVAKSGSNVIFGNRRHVLFDIY